jgi:5-formyltetrahydrofolate cyclo-ligase
VSGTLSEADAAAHRERIWADLAKVGRPDSRFHWDFSSFIADFDGSDECARTVRSLDCYQAGGLLFITPDNSTEELRAQVMADGRPFLMTTYGIARGFLHLDPSRVPPSERRYAATLDGMDRYATPVSLAQVAALCQPEQMGPVSLLVTGGSAVSRNGVRFGKGHGYFDLEFAMLSEIGAVGPASQVVDVVHDCQVVDGQLTGADHDVPVDWVVTPTRCLPVPGNGRQPGRVRWELLAGSPLRDVPPMIELAALSSRDHRASQ